MSGNDEPTRTDRDLGVLEDAGEGRWRLRFVRWYPYPPETVWRALTEAEHLEAWFPCAIVGERREGVSLEFVFPAAVGVQPIRGSMLVYRPPRILELDWGGDVLRMELERVDEGTRLTFTDTIREYGKSARDTAGWHVCLARLALNLDGRPDDPPSWKPLFTAYSQRFGAEAAAIGPPTGQPET